MNQVTDLTQFKNLTAEQKTDIDFENYEYKAQWDLSWHESRFEGDQVVYRLVIEADKWYYCEWSPDKSDVLKGVDLTAFNTVEDIPILRPATASEMPTPERVFKDGAFYPVMFIESMNREDSIARFRDGYFSAIAWGNYFSEDRFSWIGEELKIEWGKG